MRRTEQVQGLRLMKFEEVYGRTHRGGLSQAEAAEVLGVSERTFRRWRDRYEAEGADGLYDRRLGRLSARRAPVDEVARVLELFDTRYWDFTAKHFHEKLVADHGFKRSYNWLRLSLQAHGRRRAAPRRGAHRRKRPRRALPGMMLHQGRLEPRVGPRSMVGPDRHHGRCDQRYLLGLLRRRRGHHVELPGGVRGDPGQGPVLLALRRPRQPLLEHARGRRQGGQGHPDPGRPRPGAARHRVDPGLLARGKGALGAHVRHLAEAPAPGTQARRHHRHGRGQPLPQGGLPATTQRPLRDPGRGPGAPPSSPSPARSTTSCASTRNAPSQTTTRCATSAWHFRSPPAATAAITSRPGSASTNTPTAQWPSSMDRDVWRDTTPMANRSTAKPARPRDPLRRDRPAPCGQVDSRSATDHFPTGPETATEAVNSYGT